MFTWLNLCSDDLVVAASSVVTEAGGVVFDSDYHTLSDPLPFAGVVIDRNAAKVRFLYAGCFAGRGLPVVYVGPDEGSKARRLGDVAAAVGIHRVRNLPEFAAWLAGRFCPPPADCRNPAYNLPPQLAGMPALPPLGFFADPPPLNPVIRFDPLPLGEIDLDAEPPPLPPMTDGRRPCPECGEKSDVVTADETVTIWECPACGHTFETTPPAGFDPPAEPLEGG
jgi:rubredoxin